MNATIVFDPELIRRYDASGPRYTSYPTAVQFHEGFGEADYRRCAEASHAVAPPRPLSLYFHIPFCATLCFYCACNKVVTKNRALAEPYLKRLQGEIALQAELFAPDRVVDQLHWGGGTPTFLSAQQMGALMAETARRFRLRDDDGGDYSIELDPRTVDAGTVALLRELGFNRVSIGVQDFDPDVQRAVNRIQSEAQTRAVIDAARARGFGSVNLDLIYGLPHQSVASFERTLEKVLALRPDRLAVYNYAHLPERFKPQRRIRAEDLPGPQEKLEILQHAVERLTDAGYVYVGMDHFARPDDELVRAQEDGTLTRNFQGYTTHGDCDIVAMGITAISKVADCYSQNVRDREPYYARIDAGRLPVMRGVVLDADDRLRRAVIMELICHFRLDMGAIETRFGIDFAEYFAPERAALDTMAADGLLTLGDRTIEVEPAGRLLIRNICTVFDRYLQQEQAQRFSKLI